MEQAEQKYSTYKITYKHEIETVHKIRCKDMLKIGTVLTSSDSNHLRLEAPPGAPWQIEIDKFGQTALSEVH